MIFPFSLCRRLFLCLDQLNGDSRVLGVDAQADDTDGVPGLGVVEIVILSAGISMPLPVCLFLVLPLLVLFINKRPSFLSNSLPQLGNLILAVTLIQQVIAILGVEFAVGEVGLREGPWFWTGVNVGVVSEPSSETASTACRTE